MDTDPYGILGVPRNVTAEQLRQAYRNAVLKYHPDCCGQDTAEAIERFCAATDAYRTILRELPQAGGEAHTYSPQDQAAMSEEWLFIPFDRRDPDQRHWQRHAGVMKLATPTRNENRAFLWCWLAVLAAGLAVMGLLAIKGEFVVLLAFLGVYGLGLVVALWGIVATRRIIWMILRRGLFGRKALARPAAERDLPRRM